MLVFPLQCMHLFTALRKHGSGERANDEVQLPGKKLLLTYRAFWLNVDWFVS